jgi:alpha-L-fucosidase
MDESSIEITRRALLGEAVRGAAGLGLGAAEALSMTSAHASSAERYRPNAESLGTHPLPDWFNDSKLGIFIHWGLYSVPAFALKGRLEDAILNHPGRSMTRTPYAEDYWNALRDPTSPTADFHRRRYGDMPYQGFREIFEKGLAQWRPHDWARQFKAAGAGYVVLTAKYADGYCLWPSRIRNEHQPDWTSQRDIVGELAAACRGEGLHFGVYYSGGVDWSFTTKPELSLGEYIISSPRGAFPAYSTAQLKELVKIYGVDVLWNDVSWCTDTPALYELFAYYYGANPVGVVNDRWMPYSKERASIDTPGGWAAVDNGVRERVRAKGTFFGGAQTPPPTHCDFVTTEWTQFDEIQAKKWEVCRGMSTSWGYNRTETEADYESAERLLLNLIDAVSKNGNMLLNIGPRGEDAQIPSEQLSRLRRIGDWMRVNGEAIRGTRAWTRAQTRTEQGEEVRFTRKQDTVHVIVWGRPGRKTIRLKEVTLRGIGSLLSDGSPVTLETDGADTLLMFSRPPDSELGPTIRVARG